MTPRSPAPSADWTPFVHRRDIFWGDTDPAKIAYTGRFSDFVLEAIESFYRDRLGTDWFAITLDEDLGTPFVHLEFNFKSPVTPREPLAITVLVAKVGRSSVDYRLIARGANSGDVRFTAAATNVWVRQSAMKAISIPDKYRVVLEVEQAMAAAPTKTD
jgi:acyl-CoA thioesterase FadM